MFFVSWLSVQITLLRFQKYKWSVAVALHCGTVCTQFCACLLHTVPHRGESQQFQTLADGVRCQQTGLLAAGLLVGPGGYNWHYLVCISLVVQQLLSRHLFVLVAGLLLGVGFSVCFRFFGLQRTILRVNNKLSRPNCVVSHVRVSFQLVYEYQFLYAGC